jgi:transcriptional regulator with XRE-family HTH domain
MRRQNFCMGWLERLQQAERLTGKDPLDLAPECGLKYSTYRNYITGKTQPKFDVLIRICRVFDISPGYILTDAPEGTESERLAYKAFHEAMEKRGPTAVATLLRGSTEPGRVHTGSTSSYQPISHNERPDAEGSPGAIMGAISSPRTGGSPKNGNLDQSAAGQSDVIGMPKRKRKPL